MTTQEKQLGTMTLLQPAAGLCAVCAVDHEPHLPHNCQSMYYQMRFKLTRGRWPTWSDAMAHCSPAMQAVWREQLADHGVSWDEPEGGPIADPPHDSIRQMICQPHEPTRVRLENPEGMGA